MNFCLLQLVPHLWESHDHQVCTVAASFTPAERLGLILDILEALEVPA